MLGNTGAAVGADVAERNFSRRRASDRARIWAVGSSHPRGESCANPRLLHPNPTGRAKAEEQIARGVEGEVAGLTSRLRRTKIQVVEEVEVQMDPSRIRGVSSPCAG